MMEHYDQSPPVNIRVRVGDGDKPKDTAIPNNGSERSEWRCVGMAMCTQTIEIYIITHIELLGLTTLTSVM